MSYFDSLSQFQQAQEQIQEHTKSIEQEQLNSKAQDLQSRYDYHEKQLNDVAGFTTGIGAGIHGARRSYLKVKKGFQNLQDKATELKNKVQGNPDSENIGEDKEGAGDSHNNVANGQESDKPVENNTKDANQQDLEDRVADTDDKTGANNQVKDEKDPNQPDPASADKPAPAEPQAPAQQPPAANQENKASLDEPEQIGERPQTEGQSYLQDAVAPEGHQPPNPAPSEADAPAPVSEPSAGSNGAEAISDAAKNNLSDVANGVKANLGGDAENSATDTLLNGATDLTEKVLPKVAQGVSEGVSAGLETAGAVADFLGPVGEIIGAGIGLGSFFHDLFAKKKLDAQQDAIEDTPTATAGRSGIDTTSITQAGVKSNVVGTLV